MANSTLAALAAATALTGAELVYGVQAGGDVKITAAQIQTFVLGNSFLQFSGPTTTAKTFALPNASATILTTNAAVTVPQGGTGAATLLAHGILLGNGVGAIAALAVGATGTLLTGATGADPAFSATPTLGTNGGTGGAITFNGVTSGSVALQVAAAAGTGTVFQLPATNGTNGWVLQTNGSGITSWVAAAGGSPGGSSGQVQYDNGGSFGGTNLWVTDANTIEKYNSTTAQVIYSYNTRTDAANCERGVFDWTTTANTLTIGTQALGTGTARDLCLSPASGTVRTKDGVSIRPLSAEGLLIIGHPTNNSSRISLGSVTAGALTFGVSSGVHHDFEMRGGLLVARSDGVFALSTGDANGAADTGASRSAAGVIAFGNGTAGDGSATILAKTKAGAPTTSDVPAGTWALIRDTTNATTKLYYNNAGALQTVALT